MKYIFFDIDGTLLSHTEGIIESTAKALKMAKENGHKIFINTGRSLAEVGDSFDRFDFDGFVCAAGSYIKIGSEVIYDKQIEFEDVKKVTEQLKELGIEYGLEGSQFTYFTERVYKGYRERIYKALDGILDLEPSGFEPYHYMIQPQNVRLTEEYFQNPTPINKLLIYSKSREANEDLARRIGDDYFLIIYDTFAELIINGNNKATGIDRVMDYYGADLKDSVSLGDSLNDLDMIKEAGIGIAMGNASEPVKQIADIVSPDIHDDGLFKVLKELEII
ncbi:MAG TPA: Cof-type HAD-IIB family hydrolase [Tissierellaceae bacterium]